MSFGATRRFRSSLSRKLKVFLNSAQALEETKMNQVRIISELEKEKKKMQEDVSKLKEAKVTYFT